MAQDYRARLRIPVDGDPAMRLFTRSGTLVADGYLRVVIGGRGPYIEFQTVWQSHMRVPAEELYRFNDPHVYYAEYRSHDQCNVKVYWQKKTVSNQAEHKVGRYGTWRRPGGGGEAIGGCSLDRLLRNKRDHSLARSIAFWYERHRLFFHFAPAEQLIVAVDGGKQLWGLCTHQTLQIFWRCEFVVPDPNSGGYRRNRHIPELDDASFRLHNVYLSLRAENAGMAAARCCTVQVRRSNRSAQR